MVYGKLGRSTESKSILQIAIAEQGEYSSYQFGEIYAQRGDIAKALGWLDTAVRAKDPGLIYLNSVFRRKPSVGAKLKSGKIPRTMGSRTYSTFPVPSQTAPAAKEISIAKL